MTVEENEEIVRRQFELVSRGDVEGAAALWATVTFNHGRRVDREMMLKVFESLRLVQEKQTVYEMIGEREWVAVRTTCVGVHAGEPPIPVNCGVFVGLRPSGRSYSVQHMHLFRIVDGKIVEHWANRDDLSMAKQIGLALRPIDDAGIGDAQRELEKAREREE